MCNVFKKRKKNIYHIQKQKDNNCNFIDKL